MDTAGILPPPPFLDSPGKPSIPWDEWQRRFETYITAIEGTKRSAERRKALLLHCAGAEVQKTYHNQPSIVKNDGEDDYTSTLRQLRLFYSPQVNVIVERFNFRRRAQEDGETTADYVAALRGLATHCQFLSLHDEMIRDQVVEKTRYPKLRERFLQDKKLTLSQLLEVAEAYEQTIKSAAVLETSAQPLPETDAWQRVAGMSGEGDVYRVFRARAPEASERRCANCGKRTHIANSNDCPARSSACWKCGKRGHWALMCRSSKGGRGDCKDVTVLACEDSKRGPKLCCVAEVSVDGKKKELELQVDTGATVSVLSLRYARSNFQDIPLVTTQKKLFGVGRSPLKVLGTLRASVTVNDRTVEAEFYVVDSPTMEAIMGLDLLSDLGVTIIPASGRVLAVSEEDYLPPIKGYQHRIVLKKDATPTCHKLRRLPLSVREEVSQEIEKLRESGVIEPIEASEWINPVVVARKKGGSIRLCVDLRGPNSQLVTEVHPLPTISELQGKLRGSVFSRIDLKSAYHQLELHPDSRHITAFVTHDGLFQYRRVPFGLASAGAACQKLLDKLLEGIPGCVHYLDDIVCVGKDQNEHDERLKMLMKRLKEVNVTINTQKSIFAKPAIDFCGYRISAHGVAPLQSHVRAILDAPPPADVKELRSFLGMCGWFFSFIPRYADIVSPMTQLLRKDVVFDWTRVVDEAFRIIKREIASCTSLQPFDPCLATYVTTDASEKGLGAILSQANPEGQERVVAFWSRQFTPAEVQYSVTEREALAAVSAVERWKLFLWGHRFILRTDHSALTTILSSRYSGRAGARVGRWQARLAPYSYTVEYVPGKRLPGADALSRLPSPYSAATGDEDDETVVIATLCSENGIITEADLRDASQKDEEIDALRRQLLKGFPSSVKQCPEAIKRYFQFRDELSDMDGIVIRGHQQAIIPLSLRGKYLSLAHEAHDGIVRTKQLLRSLGWWPGLDKDVENLVRDCTKCQASDKVLYQHTRVAPLQPSPVPPSCWHKLGIDIIGPLQGVPPSCRFVITMIDYMSKWAEVGLVSQVTTNSIISFLSTVWAREGFPAELVSDNGPQFVSREFEDYLQQCGIKHTCSSPYWPQGNAAVERFNRTFKTWICGARLGIHFHQHVRRQLAHYRATPHCTTGQSPSRLLHGRDMRLTLPIVSARVDGDRRLEDRVQRQHIRNKRNYDTRHRTKIPDLRTGEYVHVRRQGHIPKMCPRYTGPERIEAQVGPSTYLLSDGSTRNAAHLARAAVSSAAKGGSQQDLTSFHESPSCSSPHQPTPAAAEVPANTPEEAERGEAVAREDPGDVSPRRLRELPPTTSGRRRWRPERLQYE